MLFRSLLKRNYTESRDRDIFIRRWLPALVYADSLADSAPLRKRIASEITPTILKRIAEAHRDGRLHKGYQVIIRRGLSP